MNTDTPETNEESYDDPTPGYEVVPADFARKLERERNEAIEIAKGAMHAIEMVYGHAQHCNECRSFEIANDCRNEFHGMDRIISLENA